LVLFFKKELLAFSLPARLGHGSALKAAGMSATASFGVQRGFGRTVTAKRSRSRFYVAVQYSFHGVGRVFCKCRKDQNGRNKFALADFFELVAVCRVC
jgi:hypothetical protein